MESGRWMQTLTLLLVLIGVNAYGHSSCLTHFPNGTKPHFQYVDITHTNTDECRTNADCEEIIGKYMAQHNDTGYPVFIDSYGSIYAPKNQPKVEHPSEFPFMKVIFIGRFHNAELNHYILDTALKFINCTRENYLLEKDFVFFVNGEGALFREIEKRLRGRDDDSFFNNSDQLRYSSLLSLLTLSIFYLSA